MVLISIIGCLFMTYIFMLLTMIFKGIQALLETMVSILELTGAYILGGILILILEGLVMLLDVKFWVLILTIVVVVASIAVLQLVGAIFALIAYAAAWITSMLYMVLSIVFTFLGDWCERGMKYFLGTLNQNIVLS